MPICASWVMASVTSWSGAATSTIGDWYGSSQPTQLPKSLSNSTPTEPGSIPAAWAARGRRSTTWASSGTAVTGNSGAVVGGIGGTPSVLAGPMYR